MYEFNRPLPRPEQPFEEYFKQDHFYWDQCASSDLVDSINNLGGGLEIMEAQIGSTLETSSLHVQSRVSSVSWIQPTPESQFMYDFIQDKVDRINFYHYGMDLRGMEHFQYTRYPVGGHYVYHNDIIINQDGMRKLSIVLCLSDSSEYEGGNFLFMPHGHNPESIRFQKGDLIAFPSWVPHKVEPVTGGIRRTLVTWVYGPTII